MVPRRWLLRAVRHRCAGQALAGQALVEAALILPIILVLFAGTFTVGERNRRLQDLQHATIEASLAAANEPSVPQRCNVAQDTLTRVLGRAPQTFSCTGIGTLVEVTASVLAPNYLPWGDASYPIQVSSRAVVR